MSNLTYEEVFCQYQKWEYTWWIPNLCCIIIKMQKTTPTQSHTPAVLDRNKELFELYALWKSLPIPILKQMSEADLRGKMGFDDDQIIDLVKIHYQKDFAMRYGLDEATMVDWNKKLLDRNPLFEAKGWARNLAKNMMLSMYNHAIRKGNPQLMKLFFQVANDWEEKSQVQMIPGDTTFVFNRMPTQAIEPEKPNNVIPKSRKQNTGKPTDDKAI